MKAAHVFTDIPHSHTSGNMDIEIKNIVFDSRQVESGSMFFAAKGVRSDGHTFIDKAIQAGAVCIVYEQWPPHINNNNITCIQVENSREALGRAAANFYGRPSESLQLIGITGTNGKSSTVTMLFQLFRNAGYKTGLISTIENRINDQVLPAQYTTPDAITLQQLLADMVTQGCDYVFMEVSSHAIAQHRIAGTHYTGAVFTNISHDHLDYHGTFKDYIWAKKQLFDSLDQSAFALVNKDDKRGEVMLQNTLAKKYTFGLTGICDYSARIVDNNIYGLQLSIGNTEVATTLIGKFNAYNLLTVYAVADLLGMDTTETLTGISMLRAPEGRFDRITAPDNQTIGIIDYAHSPDAFEKVLETIAAINTNKKQIITVFGCGGDRDKGKRPIMAKIACTLSDQVIITSDNPRTENPQAIITDIEKGIPSKAQHKVLTIPDRRQAIKTAAKLANTGDIILVAGKGHEKYQEIDEQRLPFDDKEELRKSWQNMRG